MTVGPLKHLARVPSLEPAIGTEPTETPGVFYHGAPYPNLREFRSQSEVREGEIGRTGIYFTQSPTYAAVYALTRGGSGGVRIYRAELITQNPAYTPAGFGLGEIEGPLEHALCVAANADGHDCLVSREDTGLVWEVAVFDKSAIRSRSSMGPVGRAAKEGLNEGLFYSVEGLPGPDYAPECAALFPNRQRAEAAFGAGRQVVRAGLDERMSIYCDAAVWPHLDRRFLQEQHVDCIIDPDTGDALVLDREKALQLNRTLARRYPAVRRRNLKQQRRVVAPELGCS